MIGRKKPERIRQIPHRFKLFFQETFDMTAERRRLLFFLTFWNAAMGTLILNVCVSNRVKAAM